MWHLSAFPSSIFYFMSGNDTDTTLVEGGKRRRVFLLKNPDLLSVTGAGGGSRREVCCAHVLIKYHFLRVAVFCEACVSQISLRRKSNTRDTSCIHPP